MKVSETRVKGYVAPAGRPVAVPIASAVPAQTLDAIALSGARPAADAQAPGSKDFKLVEATEAIIGKAGGSLEQAYFRSINLRNADPKSPDYQRTLTQFSLDAGLKRPISKDELRDMEHYLFAAAYTAGIAPSEPTDDYLDKVGKTLARELTFASAVAATVGYTAAKVANEASKALFDKPLLKSRTTPSLDELYAGIRGAARGLGD